MNETPQNNSTPRPLHTPGPWRVGEQCANEREKGELHYPIFWPDCGCAAHVFKEADARLIAAAPEYHTESYVLAMEVLQ